uniref:signal-recognition-particle GTPase n=1 Tax=Paramoeba aestuarina TaxID=180227 RepID=A0A7S4LA90_9EUKA
MGAQNRRKLIQQAVFDELVSMMDPGTKPFVPKKGRCNVFMFVGLQGAGKTTTVTKLAYHYKRKGWKVALVCADTFRAGAFDQLKQNASKIKVPFYGSYTEADPVKVAKDGVDGFREEGFEIIIVDTSGRHKQEEGLFEEMVQVQEATSPDSILFVMDGSIGQAAFPQAQAFKQAVPVGGVIMTKLDGHAKGGGALAAVAATESPIVFIGKGEHIEDLEAFVPRSFVSKLLGMGDVSGLYEKLKDAVPKDQQNQEELMAKISQGKFSLRDMYEQFQNILNMGPLGQVMEMLPGMGNIMKQAGAAGVDSNAKLKHYMTIMDSMTDQELDRSEILTKRGPQRDSRIARISRGSGRSQREVEEVLLQYNNFSAMMGKMKGMNLGKGGNLSARNVNQIAQMMPQNVVGQMGGSNNVQNLIRQMNTMEKGKR